MISRSDFITLFQYLLDYEMITLKDTTSDDHTLKMEFARYDPTQKGKEEYRYKGDCVDATLHACWWLCGGTDYIKKLIGQKVKKRIYAL